ncbi:hypothetical protein CAPTEDRAFT_203021 [Capitella teleta]|uniref:Uncharacterized protein n=1 Tax=Capitella teleta TaxID=283909 RepID=R7TUH7_CAPTE|nr:hypothetical protein CAPTEDRAFT_203021 [Capitella teleta]|eukprot:ELT95131.1 hypothetical protein CAPTEDRAFT_203021 [Capitella teleta]
MSKALDLLPGATPTIYSKENCSATAPDTWGSPPLKKRRGAFEKRQHQRILDDIFPESEVPDQTVPDVQLQSQTPLSSLTAINISSTSIGLQACVPVRRHRRSKMTQTPTIPTLQLPQRPVMASVGTQTEWERDVQPSVSEQLNVSLSSDSSYADNDQIDPDYLPEDAPPHEAEVEQEQTASNSRKYLIHDTCLRSLLQSVQCIDCHLSGLQWHIAEVGSAIVVKGSAAAVKLEELVFNKYLLKDLATLSPHYQTYDLEAFHSLLNQFAPKMTAFHFQAMNGRVLLAVMHFNENSNRQSKISRDGKEQYSIHYPKYRKGDPIVRRIKTAPTHNYVGELVKRVDILVASNIHQPLAPKPPTLASQYVTPEKGELVLRHRGRFI